MIAPNPTKSFPETFKLRVKRSEGEGKPSYFQTFEVPLRKSMNIISALQHVAAHPTTVDGKTVEPVVWDSGCLEEVCGSCTMLINGRVRQSCSALCEECLDGEDTITLEPMSKFPVVRDLWVDRQRMFDNLKKVKAWVPVDGTHDLGPGPRETQEAQEERYALSRCMTCGCCLEACPQFTKENDFLGAQVFGQVVYFNAHETGKQLKDERLDEVMQAGGITDCGNSQNCVKVCPKELPLLDAIAKLGRQTTFHAFKRFFVSKK